MKAGLFWVRAVVCGVRCRLAICPLPSLSACICACNHTKHPLSTLACWGGSHYFSSPIPRHPMASSHPRPSTRGNKWKFRIRKISWKGGEGGKLETSTNIPWNLICSRREHGLDILNLLNIYSILVRQEGLRFNGLNHGIQLSYLPNLRSFLEKPGDLLKIIGARASHNWRSAWFAQQSFYVVCRRPLGPSSSFLASFVQSGSFLN